MPHTVRFHVSSLMNDQGNATFIAFVSVHASNANTSIQLAVDSALASAGSNFPSDCSIHTSNCVTDAPAVTDAVGQLAVWSVSGDGSMFISCTSVRL